jgi:hypothetical protein
MSRKWRRTRSLDPSGQWGTMRGPSVPVAGAGEAATKPRRAPRPSVTPATNRSGCVYSEMYESCTCRKCVRRARPRPCRPPCRGGRARRRRVGGGGAGHAVRDAGGDSDRRAGKSRGSFALGCRATRRPSRGGRPGRAPARRRPAVSSTLSHPWRTPIRPPCAGRSPRWHAFCPHVADRGSTGRDDRSRGSPAGRARRRSRRGGPALPALRPGGVRSLERPLPHRQAADSPRGVLKL